MSEHPILFSGPMVRSILSGTKTQTRRVVKLPPDATSIRLARGAEAASGSFVSFWREPGGSEAGGTVVRCPFGVPGDRLWVRETFAEVHPLQVADGRHSLPGRAGIPGPPRVDYRIIFRADGEYPRLHFQRGDQAHPWREVCEPVCDRDHLHPAEAWHGWASPIHMPRWASRITLEVTGVRVERLQEISEEDAVAEGMASVALAEGVSGFREVSMRDVFAAGWDDINGKRAPWSSNPWVWVIAFLRVQP